jgi:hypothetical protein
VDKILGSYGCEYEDGCLLGFVVWLVTDVSEVLAASIIIYRTTLRNNPEGGHLHTVSSTQKQETFEWFLRNEGDITDRRRQTPAVLLGIDETVH